MKNITKKQCKKDKRVKIDKFDLFVIIMMAFTVGMLVEKIAISGISWISTIGYLG